MAPNEWVVLVPKGSIAYSVAVPKPQASRLDWVEEAEAPEPPDEPAYTVVTVYKGVDGQFPPVECNGRIIMVKEAQ